MTTISFKPGASGPFIMRFEDVAGEAMTYARTQLRIPHDNACLNIDGQLVDENYEFDLDGLGLRPDLYAAGAYYDAGEGWRNAATINLYIEGGC